MNRVNSGNVAGLAAVALSLQACSFSPRPDAQTAPEISPPPIGTRIQAHLLPHTEGARAHINSWLPWSVPVLQEKPASVTKVPTDFTAPVFVEFGFGTFDGPQEKDRPKVAAIIDEERRRCIIDTNRDGDLTNDIPCDWTVLSRERNDHKGYYLAHEIGAQIAISAEKGAPQESVKINFLDRSVREDFKHVDLSRDYATEGTVQLGGKAYHILLDDAVVCGDFRGWRGKEQTGISLRIDKNGNWRFEHRGEEYDIESPFTVNGVSYKVAQINAEGTELTLEVVASAGPEELSPPDLTAGQQIVHFELHALDGALIRFPEDYAGKVVLLDFWASWCGPCVRGIPFMRDAYERYHGDGFEILSVAIDEPRTQPKLAALREQLSLPWRQANDSGGWKGDIISRFAPEGIPAGYLVDGSTGMIISSYDSVRGDRLQWHLERALHPKGK